MKKATIWVSIAVFSVLPTGCVDNSFSLDRAAAPTGHKPVMKPPVRVETLQPKAMAILKNGLEHENAYIRNHAVQIVAESGCRSFMPEILNLLSDSSTAVRFAAATAIGDLQCFGCENQVQARLEDANENVRIAAAYALVKLNRPDYHQVIRQAALSPDQTVRANAVLLLGRLANPADLELLYEVLNDPRSVDKVRLQAVESIARLKDEQMYRSKLWALLISKYADDRVMGIRGMGALGTPEARNAILTMLQDDILEVRLAAAEQLGQLQDERGESHIFDYFQTRPNLNEVSMANNMAILAIGRIGTPRLTAYLPDALASRSEYNRLLAAQSVLLLCP